MKYRINSEGELVIIRGAAAQTVPSNEYCLNWIFGEIERGLKAPKNSDKAIAATHLQELLRMFTRDVRIFNVYERPEMARGRQLRGV